MKKGQQKKNGFGLLEVVISVSFVALFFTRFIMDGTFFVHKSHQSLNETRASFLLEEGAEVVRFIRDTSWQNIADLTPGTIYYLTWNGGKWATTTDYVKIDSLFYRKFTVTPVNRDANDDIAVSGTDDPGTKRINLSVEWVAPISTTTNTMQLYLTNI